MTAPFPAAYRLTIKSDDRVVVEIVDKSVLPGLADWPTRAEITGEAKRRFGDSVGRSIVGARFVDTGDGMHESVYELLFAPVE